MASPGLGWAVLVWAGAEAKVLCCLLYKIIKCSIIYGACGKKQKYIYNKNRIANRRRKKKEAKNTSNNGEKKNETREAKLKKFLKAQKNAVI